MIELHTSIVVFVNYIQTKKLELLHIHRVIVCLWSKNTKGGRPCF